MRFAFLATIMAKFRGEGSEDFEKPNPKEKKEKKSTKIPVTSRLYLVHALEYFNNTGNQKDFSSIDGYLKSVKDKNGYGTKFEKALSEQEMEDAFLRMQESGIELDPAYVNHVLSDGKVPYAASGVTKDSKKDIAHSEEVVNKVAEPVHTETVQHSDQNKQAAPVETEEASATEEKLEPETVTPPAEEVPVQTSSEQSQVAEPEPVQEQNAQTAWRETMKKMSGLAGFQAKEADAAREKLRQEQLGALFRSFSKTLNYQTFETGVQTLHYTPHQALEILFQNFRDDYKKAEERLPLAKGYEFYISTEERMLRLLAKQVDIQEVRGGRLNLKKDYRNERDTELDKEYNTYEQMVLDLEDKWRLVNKKDKKLAETQKFFFDKLSVLIETINSQASPEMHVGVFGSEQGEQLQRRLFNIYAKIAGEASYEEQEKIDTLEGVLYPVWYEVVELLKENPSAEKFKEEVLELTKDVDPNDSTKIKHNGFLKNIDANLLLLNASELVGPDVLPEENGGEQEVEPVVDIPENVDANSKRIAETDSDAYGTLSQAGGAPELQGELVSNEKSNYDYGEDGDNFDSKKIEQADSELYGSLSEEREMVEETHPALIAAKQAMYEEIQKQMFGNTILTWEQKRSLHVVGEEFWKNEKEALVKDFKEAGILS